MKEYLFIVINSMCGSYFQPLITYRDLIFFTIGALLIITLLSIWYSMIPTLKVDSTSLEEKILYRSKKSPFQQEITEYPYCLEENQKLSLKHKLILIFFIIVIITNPLEKLLGVDYYFI